MPAIIRPRPPIWPRSTLTTDSRRRPHGDVAGGKTKKPPVYSDWEVEEALDIEWAHAMAPQAKLFLVESVQVNTDPTWAAVQLAAKLVAKNGGGVVSMSWVIPK